MFIECPLYARNGEERKEKRESINNRMGQGV